MAKTLNNLIDSLELSNWIIIWMIPWKLSKNDIRVKYKDTKWTWHRRQPKHIHRIVDWMLKREHNKKEIIKLVQFFEKLWIKYDSKSCSWVLENLHKWKLKLSELYNQLKQDIQKFKNLNSFWYYKVDFLIFSWFLLLLQEKNNRSDAYMFKKMFSALWKEYWDLYDVITDATANYSK